MRLYVDDTRPMPEGFDRLARTFDEAAAWRDRWLLWVEVRVTYAVVRVNELERRLVDPLPCEVWAAALELLALTGEGR